MSLTSFLPQKRLLLAALVAGMAAFPCMPFASAQEPSDAPGTVLPSMIGPEPLLPLDQRGIIRLGWKPYEQKLRFEFKPFERPVYRIFIAPEGTPAGQGRVHVTYDVSYPFTNLLAGRKYNIKVDVEQNGAVVLPEAAIQAKGVLELVKWFAAPRGEGGSSENPGTYESPKDVAFVNANAGPGDVVVLKSGIYFSPAEGRDDKRHDTGLHPARSGEEGKRILFLAESNDIAQRRHVSFQTVWGNISVNRTDYAVFDGLNCDSDQGRNAKALTSILGEYGHRPTGVIVRNIYYRAATADKHIMVNASRFVLIENCFFPGSTESHNVYLCNNTQNRPEYGDSRCVFRNCISMNSTRNNVHANGFFDNFIIENNILVGAKVANISLATVHRNSHVRNNIAYTGAKQALTMNFYHGNVPLEDQEPCANIHICHNTFVVPETTEYTYAPILVSDSRRLPYRHTIRGLSIKNNILAVLRKDAKNMLLDLIEARHLEAMEVQGNVGFSQGNEWGYEGEVRLPARSSGDKALFPFTLFEEHASNRTPLECLDMYRDGDDGKKYEPISIHLRPWFGNKMVGELGSLFADAENRDYRLAADSPALGAGVVDPDIRRIVRDIYGNIRDHGKGLADAGAIAGGSKLEVTTGLSEYRLLPPEAAPAGIVLEGARTLVASARLLVRSPGSTALRNFIVELVLEKEDPNRVINVKKHLAAELEVNGRTKPLAFFKDDKIGYEKLWLSGWAGGMNVRAESGETLDVKVFITLNDGGRVKSVGATIAHDNIWGFDGRGWKMAVTGMNELHFFARKK